MTAHFWSTVTPAPEGFTAVALDKRLLLNGQVAIFTDDADAVVGSLERFTERVHGLVITPGPSLTQTPIGPLLWRVWVPERLLTDLRAIAASQLALLAQAIAEHEDRHQRAQQARRARLELELTRRDYHRVTQALHHQMRALMDAQQARTDAETARRMAELKSAFIDSVSHELRTPLTSIRGYAEFLEDRIGGELSTEQDEFVTQIQLGALRLQHLVDDLLDSARMEAGSFRLALGPADLAEKVREVTDSLRPQIEEARLKATLVLPDGPLEAHFDARRIGQVLINLLANAIKFTPSGGHIRVEARHEPGPILGAPRTLRCSVTDTGIGIAEEDQDQLFQRFRQLAGGVRQEAGTGLGLHIAKALVEAHGGGIGVESRPGEGSTFWFTLPVGAAPSEPACEAERAGSGG
jgi:signal transduction histidine kinase